METPSLALGGVKKHWGLGFPKLPQSKQVHRMKHKLNTEGNTFWFPTLTCLPFSIAPSENLMNQKPFFYFSPGMWLWISLCRFWRRDAGWWELLRPDLQTPRDSCLWCLFTIEPLQHHMLTWRGQSCSAVILAPHSTFTTLCLLPPNHCYGQSLCVSLLTTC